MPHVLKPRATRNGRSRSGGFSLIELAIGLVIVTTLLSALLVPLATQMDQRRVSETQKQLEMARDALIGYAISQGRLPCPATALSNGKEEFVPVTGNATSGECLWMNGFLPAVTLGLAPLDKDGFFRDAYGTDRNRIRYAVSTASVTVYTGSLNCENRPTSPAPVDHTRVLTKSNGMKTVTMQMVAQVAECDNRLLYICAAATTPANACNEADNRVLSRGGAAAAIWSVGRNAADTGRTVPADELENLDVDDDRFLVARERRDTADNEFDDIVLWISPSLLLSRMAAAGALP